MPVLKCCPADISGSLRHPDDIARLSAHHTSETHRPSQRQAPASTIEFEEAISRVVAPTPREVEPLYNNLPKRELIVGEFIGRQKELNVLRQWLQGDKVKWALTGAGGKGKTNAGQPGSS
jgi:hypothetical protein